MAENSNFPSYARYFAKCVCGSIGNITSYPKARLLTTDNKISPRFCGLYPTDKLSNLRLGKQILFIGLYMNVTVLTYVTVVMLDSKHE